MYIPTALSRREVDVLRKYGKDQDVTEAGSLLGFSTIKLAEVARRVTSIDRHCGYERQPNSTLRQFKRNLQVAGVYGRTVVVVGAANVWLNSFPAAFVFIDLCGTRSGTIEAVRAARAPIIAVHDFERQNCSGVALAVRDSGFSVIERVDSLIVLQTKRTA